MDGPPKSEWGEGPWQHEPDHLEWVDEATGYSCKIRRGPTGALCGYVGIPPGHPAHGLHTDGTTYAEATARTAFFRSSHTIEGVAEASPWEAPVPGIGEAIADVAIHGGLTYAAPDTEDPLEWIENKLWWFGFDCAHVFDFSPQLAALTAKIRGGRNTAENRGEVYRDMNYVCEECISLARQLKAMEALCPEK